ncbi:YdeI/OmpD-associated family protein [Luteimonas sp. RD2P54]|uniref:YdeI/OmpD-associated family protein n=1 Tax=Luteimonas endophytica TaxID=3042023 RepID=A0ABT6J5A9_9GAMM|nr:YdeI/OmpD-associated family protein [Luteimonas endophytica]MDH5821959.1 YdeI/OmpD-associated family protein [Luteimonas endophytica]
MVLLVGINPYVPVTAAQAAKLKQHWRGPMPVRYRIDGRPRTPWRINMMPYGDGSFCLYLHAAARAAAETQVGDEIEVELTFDDAYHAGPVDPMPAWFEDALSLDRAAGEAWEALTPSLQKEILRYFARLKSPQAQERNLHKALHVLAGGEGRFLARDWRAGRVVQARARRQTG